MNELTKRDVSLTTEATDVKQWSVNQLDFQYWLSLPSHERGEQRDFARVHDLAEETLSRWKRLPGFMDAVFDLAKQRITGDKLPKLLDAQADLAISAVPFASTQAAQLVLTALGQMPKTSEVNVDLRQLVVRDAQPAYITSAD
jgi:hypothetical protein